MKAINKKETKQILQKIEKQFGCNDLLSRLDYIFLINNKNRLYILNRDFSRIDSKALRIDSLGLYFGELKDAHIRLSIEGSQIIGAYAKKNIVELTDVDAKKWIRGEVLDIDESKYNNIEGFVIIKNKNNFCGSGSIRNGKLLNYIPKVRRIVVSS